jgi:tetratricopeptide (TPR) repeat protein
MAVETPVNEILSWLTKEMYERDRKSIPLDDLYSDGAVGAYARNISIDSPFQQMVNRGVLSLIHLDGELQIQFTQEGLYHHLLSRHFHSLSKEKGVLELTRDLVQRKSNGFLEGYAGLLETLIRKGNRDTLSLVIDEFPELVKPAAIGLILDIEINGISVLDTILEHPTENDILVLIETFETLEHRSRLQPLKQMSPYLLDRIAPKSPAEFLLCAKCLKFTSKAVVDRLYEAFIESFSTVGSAAFRKDAAYWLDVHDLFAIEFLRYSEKATAFALYQKAYALAVSDGSLEEEALRLLGLIGQVKKSLGRPSEARRDYEEAIRGLSRLGRDTTAARNMLRLSEVHKQAAEFGEALVWAVRAQAVMESHFGSSSTENAQALSYLGSIHIYMGEWELAEEPIRRSMEVRMRLLGEGSTKTCISYVNYAKVLSKLGDTEKAMALLNRAYGIRLGRFGGDHQDVAYTLFEMAELRLTMGDREGAAADHARALGIRMGRLGARHFFTLRSRLSLLGLQLEMGVPPSEATDPKSLREDLESLGDEGKAMSTEMEALLGRRNG